MDALHTYKKTERKRSRKKVGAKVYHCEECNAYHIGHWNKKKMKRRR